MGDENGTGTNGTNGAIGAIALTLHQCWEKKKEEFEAVPEDALKKVVLDCSTVVRTISGVQRKVGKFRAAIAKDLPATNMTYFDDLEVYVGALTHAHRMHGLLVEYDDAPIAEWADALAEEHQTLFATAELVVQSGFMKAPTLPELRARTSHNVLILNTMKLVELLRLSWEQIENKTVLTRQMLEDIEARAVRLQHALGDRDQREADISASTLARQRAYTVTLRAYSEVRRAISWLRWFHGDADDLAPVLANKRGTGSGDDSEPDPKDVTQPAANDRSSTGATTTAQPAAPPTAPAASSGPNSPPFVR